MSETNMPAAEAVEMDGEQLLSTYELAFHVLPTVAEGEVTTVFQGLKDKITKIGGSITIEEAPERFDLAYEIIKHLEGRNRKFTSAYFGWVRFTAAPNSIEGLGEEVEGVSELLRHLLVKLTKTEEANPFYFHEALEEQKIKDAEIEAAKEQKKPRRTTAAKSVTEDKKEESDKDGEESKDKV